MEIAWSEEARTRVERAPAFVRPGIVKLMERRARERGRSLITSEFLTEIRNESMLRVAKCIRGFGFEELHLEAFEVAKAKMRKLPRKVEVIAEIQTFLAARTQKNEMILEKFRQYLERIPERGLPWTDEALARLHRAPVGIRELARHSIEAEAQRRAEPVVTPEAVETVLAGSGPEAAGGPAGGQAVSGGEAGTTLPWTAEAEERLRRIPIAAVRTMVMRRAERCAREGGLEVVDLAVYERALAGGIGPPPQGF